MRGVCDYLVGDGRHVYLANVQFDADSGDYRIVDDPQHLRGGKAGLLETSWTQANLALRKSIQDWTARDSAGQLLAFDDRQAFGFRVTEEGQRELFATGPATWRRATTAPRLVLAMLAGDDCLAVAGANERFRASAGGFLEVRRVDDGSLCGETVRLPAPPVVDGLAISSNRFYVALQDGSVAALGR
jgi:hypothetical protein